MKNRILYLTCVSVMALLSSCGRGAGSGIEGEWQLVEYCYGTDCTMLADHGMIQVWELNSELAGDTLSQESWKKGVQRQDSVMHDEIEWMMNGDSLLVVNKRNGTDESFLVSVCEADTLILTSMLNNKLVRQRFMRM